MFISKYPGSIIENQFSIYRVCEITKYHWWHLLLYVRICEITKLIDTLLKNLMSL